MGAVEEPSARADAKARFTDHQWRKRKHGSANIRPRFTRNVKIQGNLVFMRNVKTKGNLAERQRPLFMRNVKIQGNLVYS